MSTAALAAPEDEPSRDVERLYRRLGAVTRRIDKNSADMLPLYDDRSKSFHRLLQLGERKIALARRARIGAQAVAFALERLEPEIDERPVGTLAVEYRRLDAIVRRIDKRTAQREQLYEERRELFRQLLAGGEPQAKIARTIGKSPMVVDFAVNGSSKRKSKRSDTQAATTQGD